MPEINISPITKISVANLPNIGAALDAGTFSGITKLKDGMGYAVVLLPGQGEGLTLAESIAWAEQQVGELPTRSALEMLLANDELQIRPVQYWTSDDSDTSFALYSYLTTGRRLYFQKNSMRSAVAVRLIPVTA